MARTDQEQELVLGNKQLLSAFFVVVCLLAVFFTAGYIIGSNSTKKPGATVDASANASPATEAAQRVADRTKTEPEPVVTPKPQEPEQEPSARVAENKEPPAPKPQEKVKERDPKPETLGAVTAQVTPGHQYLQLMAVKRPVADNMVKLLKGRGYPALLGESSKPELFRVLVGPFTDMASLAKTKAGLKAAGFESVIAK